MKASINLTGLDSPGLTAESISIEVEYSIEEFNRLLSAYPQLLAQIIQLTKENHHDQS